jgi:hypothetical protein
MMARRADRTSGSLRSTTLKSGGFAVRSFKNRDSHLATFGACQYFGAVHFLQVATQFKGLESAFKSVGLSFVLLNAY